MDAEEVGMVAGTVRVGLVKLDQVDFHPHNLNRPDLRGLAQSIANYGLLEPIVVEQHGARLRLRAGHRRVAAATTIGLRALPALIHPAALGPQAWLEQSIQENALRQDLDLAERRRALAALRELGCSWSGIAGIFGVTPGNVRAWQHQPAQQAPHPRGPGPRARATRRLVERHREEFTRLLAEETSAETEQGAAA